jgi:hypothetical protein
MARFVRDVVIAIPSVVVASVIVMAGMEGWMMWCHRKDTLGR